jgi:hypothetical protein
MEKNIHNRKMALKKVTKTERGRPSGPLKIHIELAEFCKNTSASYLSQQINTSIAEGRKFSCLKLP